MIHFLGKIFLEYAETKPLQNKLNTAPSQYIRIVDKGLSSITDVQTQHLNIVNFKNIEECLDHFNDINRFIDFLLRLSQNDKVIIYCDEDAMKKLMILLWKSIFPNITVELVERFLVSYRDSEAFKKNDFNEYINIQMNSNRITKDNFLPGYWLADKAFIEDSLKLSPINLKGKEDLIGLEYFFIKTFLTGTSGDEIYRQRFEYLYKKNFMKEVLFMIDNIKEYAILLLSLRNKTKDLLLKNKSFIDYLKSEEDYKILFDDQMDFNAESYDRFKQNYKMIKVINTLFTDCTLIHNKINPEFVSIQEIEVENPDFKFVEVDRDEYMDLAIEWGIMGIPSFVVIEDGKEKARLVNKLRKTKEEVNTFLASAKQYHRRTSVDILRIIFYNNQS